MFTDQIERMKRQYTDKYVVVDATRPELVRFRDVVGRVKTVNMSGRALVEFDEYHLNTGWYDIDPEFLKVVDKPPPKAPKPEVKKPAAKAEPKPAAAAKPPAAKAAAAGATPGKQSVADILAAARAGKGGAPAAAKTQAAAPAPSQPQPPAPAKTEAVPKVDRSKMSVADMLAAARTGGVPKSAPSEAKAEAAPAKAQAPQAPAQTEAIPVEPPAESAPASASPASAAVIRCDKSNMTVDDIIAYCRQHDAK